jgi:short-subunit dehydrogenase
MAASSQDFRGKYGPTALILGGSEGIGRQFAAQLAALGLDLVLVARREAPLEAAAAELRAAHGVRVTTRAADLAAPDVGALARSLLSAHEVGLLVCNAGATHGVGMFVDEPLDKALALARLNCLAPLAFAHEALARMRPRGKGGMIVVSSMSGLSGSGLIATYAASKAFEIALCEGLNWELSRAGVDVLCAVAGLTDTPAMRRSGLSYAAAAAAGFTAMDAAEVARGALAHLGRGAIWYAPGAPAAAAMRAMPREALTASMTQAAAALYNVALR